MSAISSSTYAASSATDSSATAARPSPAGDYIKSQVTKVANFFQSNPLVGVGISALINAGTGALAAGLFTTLSPLGGAIYGLTCAAASRSVAHAIEWICEKTGYHPEHMIMKIAAAALPMIAGIGAGCAAVSLAGFALTPGAVVAFTIGTIGLGIAAGIAAGCATCGLFVGAALYDVYYANPQSNAGSSTTRV